MTPEALRTGLAATGERRQTPGPARHQHAWDPNGPPAGAIAPGLWAALQAAVEEVRSEWDRIVEHAASAEEVTSHLAELGNAVRATTLGQEPDLASLPHSQLSRRLLALIRSAFIHRVSPPAPAPDVGQLLAVLGAIEQVSQGLEPNWAQHLSDRLSGPDGLELVVEVAHDLRSPLTSILFLAETLQRARSGPVNEVQERQLGLIYSAAFGLSSMASDVIELARGGDRLVDLDPLPFSMVDIFESVRDIVLPIAEEKGLEVRLGFPAHDFRVGHPVALSRVLLNLTTNALKFTGDGHVELAGSDLGDNRVEFSVRDTGRGIPSQNMATLFEPFRRRQREGEYAFSGSGLGLSICRKLVEAMGSTLQVETTQDVGTRFYFVLALPPAGQDLLG